MRVLLPYAAWLPGAAEGLDLSALYAFFNGLQAEAGRAADGLLAHEQLLAQAVGQAHWPATAWARQAQLLHPQPQEVWSRWSLCHWQMGMNDGQLRHPAHMALEEAEAKALWADLQPLLAEHGVALTDYPVLPPYARHAALEGPWQKLLHAPLPSLEAAAGHNLRPWLEAAPPALHALMTEAQMLLYNHPVNIAREARRQSTLNSLWVDGLGAWPAEVDAASLPHMQAELMQAAVAGQVQNWRSAWQQLLQHQLPQWQAAAAQGEFELLLCGPQRWLRLQAAPKSGWHGLRRWWQGRGQAPRDWLGELLD